MADRFTKMHGLGNDFVVIDAREGAVGMTPRARMQSPTGGMASAATS